MLRDLVQRPLKSTCRNNCKVDPHHIAIFDHHGLVTRTGGALEAYAVHNGDTAVLIVNDTGLLKHSSC